MEHTIEQVTAAMIAYDAGDPMRIHHFLKVHAFARFIGLSEGLDTHTQSGLEAAALVHDIGIHKAEAVYGSCGGKYQEELGPAEAETLLTPLDLSRQVIERVMYLVGHHHTLTDVEGLDYQILLEADYLVNADEHGYSGENVENTLAEIFRTATGSALLRAVYQIR